MIPVSGSKEEADGAGNSSGPLKFTNGAKPAVENGLPDSSWRPSSVSKVR